MKWHTTPFFVPKSCHIVEDLVMLCYSETDRKKVLSRFKSLKDEFRFSVDEVCQKTGLSIRTINRLLSATSESTPRNSTLKQISDFIANTEEQPSTFGIGDSHFTNYIAKLMNVDSRNIQRISNEIKGSYQCLRLTIHSNEILSTYLHIKEEGKKAPKFHHIGCVPDEIHLFNNTKNRTLEHKGEILSEGRRLYFPSVGGGNFRLLIAIRARNKQVKDMTGLLLSIDAINHQPFAARIILKYLGEADCFQDNTGKFGVFSKDNQEFDDVIKFLENCTEPSGVLRCSELS